MEEMLPIEIEPAFVDRLAAAASAIAPGSRVVSARSLHGGISAEMTAFEIELSEGERRKLVARVPSSYKYGSDPDVAREEYGLLRELGRIGLPVPQARYVEARTEEVPRPFFVVEYIEGAVELSPTDRDAYLQAYADQLAQIHAVDLSRLQVSLPEDEEVEERSGPPNERLLESEIRSALRSWPTVPRNAPVLRHGDFWPGNMLWREGRIVGVIDWEESVIGEPLADLAISRLDLLWILDLDAMEQFTERYLAQVDLDSSGLAYWDLWASLRPIRNMHQWSPGYAGLGRPDITTETMERDHRLFVERALSSLTSARS
jgi:aminoglycoside phosphotransferase (APT) family kinase protein